MRSWNDVKEGQRMKLMSVSQEVRWEFATALTSIQYPGGRYSRSRYAARPHVRC